MNMKLKFGTAALVLCLASHSALARSSVLRGDGADLVREINDTQIEIDLATAPIKSRADLLRHLRVTQDSPLSKLPPSIRDNFIRSLVFTRYGLASYSYLGLNTVSTTDLYAVFSLFGHQRYLTSVPGLKAVNETERSILFVSAMGGGGGENTTEEPPIQNSYCTVDGPDSWCTYEYGSACNAKCK